MTTLHDLIHRIPGVAAHRDLPPGHQGRPNPPAARAAHQHHGHQHPAPRPPRVLAGWQRRIGALFGQRD